MNILFITIAWPSPSEKNLYTDLMDEFVLNGHKVYVAGTHNNEELTKDGLKNENGIEVLRINSGNIRKSSYFRKAVSLFFLGRHFLHAVNRYLTDIDFDLLIAPTPPITLSRLFKKLKKKYNSPFYLLLKDIWPQGSVDLKVIRKYGIPWIYLRSHETRLYRVADYIGCMSPLGVKYILSKNKFIPENKVEVCPNSIRPVNDIPEIKSGTIRDKYNIPQDACVFIFSGNLGVGHGLHFLAEAIKLLSDYSKAFFLIGGSGTHYQYLKKRFAEFVPRNAFLYSWLPRDDFEQIMGTSDVGLILLYRYTSPQFPSRLLSYLEYSKPVLCAVNEATDIGTTVEKNNCGRSVMHGDLESFVDAIKYFSENINVIREMGENGRKLLMNNYTVTHSYEIIMSHFRAS